MLDYDGTVQSLCDKAHLLAQTNHGARDTTTWKNISEQYGMPGHPEEETPDSWRLYVLGWCAKVKPMDNLDRNVVLAELRAAGNQAGFDWVIRMTDAEYDLQRAFRRANLKGRADVVKRLLAAGADVEAVDDEGWRALVWASLKGHADVVEVLLANGAKVDAEDEDGDTALMMASLKGHVAVVEVLLAAKANVDHKAAGGWTALMYASGKGYEYVVHLLLAAGADVHARDGRGDTALMRARAGGHTAVVALLWEATLTE